MNDGSGDYALKVQQQIDQYITQPIHDLPDIFHVWSEGFIRPGLESVFGISTINDFYVGAAREASNNFERPVRILSLGCGDGAVELELAKTLKTREQADFHLDALDISPVLIERFSEGVRENGLQDRVVPAVSDLNEGSIEGLYDVVLANHSLHHMVDLERVFDLTWNVLREGGIFATCDMIGRNGHMRWPETEKVVQAIWPLLTEKQRFHHQLLDLQLDQFRDHDSSKEGFEGIRAQDILYLILDRFHPYKFFAYGGFIEVLVDRGYGHGFDPDNEQHRNFIIAFAKINDMMLDSGMIKPTIMSAYFTKEDRGERFYRTRSAQRSLRLPFDQPEWTKAG